MVQKRTCDYSGQEIEPGTGTMYVKTDGTVLWFADAKCEKNYLMGREARDLEWIGDDDYVEAEPDEEETEEADSEADEAESDAEAEAESDDDDAEAEAENSEQKAEAEDDEGETEDEEEVEA
jgi:large subunit ribosomal protein L24e